jgi:hypothetical protein
MRLKIRMHSERAHPTFCTREMRDVERSNVAAIVAPKHRAFLRVGNRKSPHSGIQIRNPNAGHSVFPITIGKRIAEHRIQ